MQANIISTFFIENLIVNELTFDVDQFKTNLFLSMIVNEEFKICTGLGWETDRVLFKVLYTMKFWNCSKTLVDDLADFSKTWTGFEAKYFEDCNQSNNAEVRLYEKEYYKAKDDQMWLGTTNPKSVFHCKSLFGTTSAPAPEDPAMIFGKMAYKTFFNWMTSTYPEAFQ